MTFELVSKRDVPNVPDVEYRIYERPVHLAKYAAAADIGAGTHPTAIRVWRYNPRKLVAECHGHLIPENLVAVEIAKLGKWYNNAVLNVEVYAYGRVTRSDLMWGNTYWGTSPYLNLYSMPDSVALRQGDYENCSGDVFWQATVKSRDILFGKAQDIIAYTIHAEHTVIPSDDNALDEYENLIYDVDGKPRPSPGSRDDRVVADALAWMTFEQPYRFDDDWTPPETPPRSELYFKDGKIMLDFEMALTGTLRKKKEVVYG